METNNTLPSQPVDDNKNKTSRSRSSKYPSHTIESSKAFVDKIDKEFGTNIFTPQASISETLELSGGSFLMQLSTAVQYGLLDSSYGNGYKPSQLFKKIQRPLPNENVNDFLLESLYNPPLYKKLLDEYKDKQLPSEKGLSNILDRLHGVFGDASNVAAKIFYKNIAALELLGADNILRLNSFVPFVEEQKLPKNPEQKEENPIVIEMHNPSKQKNVIKYEGQQREIPIILDDGTQALVTFPKYNSDNIKRVIKVLTGYLD